MGNLVKIARNAAKENKLEQILNYLEELKQEFAELVEEYEGVVREDEDLDEDEDEDEYEYEDYITEDQMEDLTDALDDAFYRIQDCYFDIL